MFDIYITKYIDINTLKGGCKDGRAWFSRSGYKSLVSGVAEDLR